MEGLERNAAPTSVTHCSVARSTTGVVLLLIPLQAITHPRPATGFSAQTTIPRTGRLPPRGVTANAGGDLTPVAASASAPGAATTQLDLGPQPDLLTSTRILSFERDGHVRLPQILSADEVRTLRHACVQSMEKSRSDAALHALNTNGEDFAPPFLQHFNPWRTNESIAQFCRSPRLASVAAALLNADTVRLYQDCIFQKRPGDASTDWHADLKMVPLDTNRFVTVWVALDFVPTYDDGGSALHFVPGSHRDFSLAFWHGEEMRDAAGSDFDLTDRYGKSIVEQDEVMQPGDSTWHHGWTLHSAPDLFDDETQDRLAYTASYVAEPVRLLSGTALGRHDKEDAASYEDWVGSFNAGDYVDHELLPIVWPIPS